MGVARADRASNEEWVTRKRLRPSARLLRHHGHDVFFAHDQQFLAIHLHGLAGVLAEQHAVANLDVQRDRVALVVFLARADSQHFALIRLFCGGVGNDDAGCGLRLVVQALHDHAIMQGTQIHTNSSMQSECLFTKRAAQVRRSGSFGGGSKLLALPPGECQLYGRGVTISRTGGPAVGCCRDSLNLELWSLNLELRGAHRPAQDKNPLIFQLVMSHKSEANRVSR
uniref:Uncharacterized protein n=1 Tax=Ralstonia solanacearum TaxID=305 RepID=A0A0S4X8H6_RALSL|nr:conserved protein of unknown function [Ralstonia solanacearum]CUV38470.1 conserved protein of unknown function [Ralstonia solanacearum]CUV60263.1 conserved protein of unknown function [Ralstonia solanacearum]